MDGVQVALERHDSGRCLSMHERVERMESPGTYVTE